MASGTYLEHLVVPVDVAVIGAGVGATVVDGGGTGTVVTVPAGVTATLADLTVTNGFSDGDGGGVRNEGGLGLQRVEVVANRANDGGAGIYSTGSVEVVDTTVVGNTGMIDGTGHIGGGGIAATGSSAMVVVRDSTVRDNTLVTPGTDQRGGGGIAVRFGDVVIEDSAVLDNDSGYSSGGVYVAGSGATLSLTRSTVSGNQTGTDPNRGTGRGGGVSVRDSASTTITSSTISGNHSASSGGGLHAGAATTVVNSTVSGNTAASAGGGILADLGIALTGVTVAGNVADRFGGGIYAFGDTIAADDLLVGDNTAPEGPDCHTTIAVADGRTALVEQTDSSACLTSGSGTILTGVDPALGALSDNGGPTQTQALLEGSPAIDAGSSMLTTDQRGLPRPAGTGPDIGAFEVQPSIAPPFELVPAWGGVGSDIGARAVPTDGTACGWVPDEVVELWWDDPEGPLGSATVDADGCFEIGVFDTEERLAGSALGTHKVTARGTISGSAQAAYELMPRSVALNPGVGPAEGTAAVAGCGWTGATGVNVFWAETGDVIARDVPVDPSTGCLTGSATIPAVRTDGLYAVVASEGDFPGPDPVANASATLYWVRTATILLTPDQAPPGGEVELAGCNWFPDEAVTFRSLTDDLVFDVVAVADSGCFRADGPNPVTLSIPSTASLGEHVIRATGADSGQVVDTDFEVVEEYITFDPDHGVAGDSILVTGCGWTGNTQVVLEWGYPDTNNLPIRWSHPIDRDTGCLEEPGLTIEVPDNTPAGLVLNEATGDVTGATVEGFTVDHAGTMTVPDPDTEAGDTLTVQIQDAIVGETLSFRVDASAPFDGVGVVTPDFTHDLILPLDLPVGTRTLSASGTKGFSDDAPIDVLDTSTLTVTTTPLAPGVRMDVSGTRWGAGERIDFELRRDTTTEDWIEVGATVVSDVSQDFAVTLTLPDDLDDGAYVLRATGDLGRTADTQLELVSPTLLVDPVGTTAGSDVAVTGEQWGAGELVFFSLQTASGGPSDPLGFAALGASDGTLSTTFRVPSHLPDGSYLLVATGESGRTATALFWVGERTVALTITEVHLLQSTFDGDVAPGDLYPRIVVDDPDFPPTDVALRDEHTSDVLVADPMWTTPMHAPLSAPTVMPVEISLFDWDSGSDPALEAQADANPDPGAESLLLPIDLATGTWPGAPLGQACYRGDDVDIAIEVCVTTSVVSDTGDIDEDGFLDTWELHGIDRNGDGVPELDLPAMGANPCRKDIGLDYGALLTREPLQDSIDANVAAFDTAPITPPNDCPVLGIEPEPGIQLLVADVARELYQDEYGCADLRADRAVRQTGVRQRLFHYAMFVNRRPGTTSSGVACGDGAVIISLGSPDADTNRRLVKEASTLMHELGHALGLWHGGFENLNYKPNYLSVMNYRFQLRGLFTADASMFVLDYSREEFATIDEEAVDEQALTALDLETAWVGPDGQGRLELLRAPADDVVDWNANGVQDSEPYGQDLNNDASCVSPGPDGVLDTEIPEKYDGEDVDDVVMTFVRASGTTVDRIVAGADGICHTTADEDSDDKQSHDVGFDALTNLRGHDDWAAVRLRADRNLRGAGLELDATHPHEDDLTTEELDEQYAFWFSPALTVDAPEVTIRQGEEATNTGTVFDADLDEVDLTASVGTITDNGDGTWSWNHTVTEAVGSHEVTITADDHDEGSTTETFMLVVEDRPAPAIEVEPVVQTVQSSDAIVDVVITATGRGPDDLTLDIGDLPGDLAVGTPNCQSGDSTVTCSWTLSGQMTEGAGDHVVEVVAVDHGVRSDAETVTFHVVPERARVVIREDNPVAVEVTGPGETSEPFSLSATVSEAIPDLADGTPLPGNVATADVSMALVPIGPGATVAPDDCHESLAGEVGADQQLTLTCDFDDVAVNTYAVTVTVDGAYWSGAGEDVLTVFDPSLGRASGGGSFVWPETADSEAGYAGDRTSFGFTMEYNRKGTNLRGSLLVVRHLPDGTTYRVKSNALDGLALGEDPGVPMGWATFTGKATYLEPGWEEPEGNHGFTVYVEDRGQPGAGTDRFWLQVRDRDGQVVDAFSIEPGADVHARTLTAGNILVPHGGR